MTCIDSNVWLDEAIGDDDLDDGRTVAQVVVGQAEFADALVLTRPHAQTLKVLRRLAPPGTSDRRGSNGSRWRWPISNRTAAGDAATALTIRCWPGNRRSTPTVTSGCCCSPHAGRFIRSDSMMRWMCCSTVWCEPGGRMWLASRFDDVMWLESAGGGMRFEYAGRWLAALSPPSELAYADPQRCALAAADWDDRLGDRHVSIAVLVCGAEPEDIVDALRGALLTDEEWSNPHDWPSYPDPFGDWHEDPCGDMAEQIGEFSTQQEGEDR